ncbi:hypothetical protein QQ73_06385, partial [Candidatus Endoriftia persephone str. Guaymas]|nr:hypothetical protein [Candidatus Endoriftia persephone str. Guaymas]
ASAATSSSWPVGPDTDHATVEFTAVERCNSGAGFVSFHIDNGKALAITGEEIFYQFERTDHAVFRKECCQTLFCGRSRETTNRKGNQCF